MYWYKINIPFYGNIYIYIGITVGDPEIRIFEQHPYEEKEKNQRFKYIIENVSPDLWEAEAWEVPIIYGNCYKDVSRLCDIEKAKIAEYDSYEGPFGLNASPGGEHPWINCWGLMPGMNSGARGIFFDDCQTTWTYKNKRLNIKIINSDLRILARMLESMDLLDIIDPVLWKKSLEISDTYRPKIKRMAKYLGAHNICIETNKAKQGFNFALYKRGIRKRNVKPSYLLQRLIDDPEINLKNVFFDFQYFMYCATAALMGYFDLDQKLVIGWMSEEDFRQRHEFSLDKIDYAIYFLQQAEAQQKLILKERKLLQPKIINT